MFDDLSPEALWHLYSLHHEARAASSWRRAARNTIGHLGWAQVPEELLCAVTGLSPEGLTRLRRWSPGRPGIEPPMPPGWSYGVPRLAWPNRPLDPEARRRKPLSDRWA